jgi:hypothetical protein
MLVEVQPTGDFKTRKHRLAYHFVTRGEPGQPSEHTHRPKNPADRVAGLPRGYQGAYQGIRDRGHRGEHHVRTQPPLTKTPADDKTGDYQRQRKGGEKPG